MCPSAVIPSSSSTQILPLFPMQCPPFTALVVAKSMAAISMPGQRDVDNVCALRLSSGFQDELLGKCLRQQKTKGYEEEKTFFWKDQASPWDVDIGGLVKVGEKSDQWLQKASQRLAQRL
ncbi:unnamed protein product [Pleuronectes platessa]|uniref:Uncharacterized protein n=1 Tax=Pleuronectes platessa TaxID=8262 RepID=A0A9N7UF68_PLEPL|nr:unnamed protein product [Pleuronectes platessa]